MQITLVLLHHLFMARYVVTTNIQRICASSKLSLYQLLRHIHDSLTFHDYRLPDNVSYEEGALVEPLSVGLYSIERGNVKIGDRVIIFGAGPVGLLCAAAAKAAGAACVMIAGKRKGSCKRISTLNVFTI